MKKKVVEVITNPWFWALAAFIAAMYGMECGKFVRSLN